ncbi:zwei Ig domain protein zig-8 isoform X2 [Cephus cinctus]|uniref:Zwei Ig domain protein zig-8 isoform X2 n=1 Tax=Cephus cinctus TaxID=211228 RepID=A0AAJ7RTV7_CEPCN|nr:zwei Ig domain protein zig-8 isoform X2 [Cephus cinctus]
MPSGAAWGSRLFLVLTMTTIVIANYHRQRDNSIYREHYSDNVRMQNTARAQEENGVQLPPMKLPHLRHHHVTHWGPYFENAEGEGISESQTVALHLGTSALLDCRVAMLADKMVMWMRRSTDGVSLLTVGKNTYSSDPRYSLNFQYPNNWRLAISSVQKEDHGQYVCQVSTHPPRMLNTEVTVLAPDIKILDEASHEVRDRYYKTGSGIELSCIVRPSQPGSIVPHPTWKKNGEMLPDHVSVYRINGSNEELVTRFKIERAEKTDSGVYTCSLGQFSTTMVQLHVLNGEKQAAVHHDQWNAARTNYHESRNTLFTILTAFLFLQASSTYSL